MVTKVSVWIKGGGTNISYGEQSLKFKYCNIVDDERSGTSESSELSSSPGTSLPELEDQENINPVPVLPPVGNPPPYTMSCQRAVHSKGVPKSTFHPYCCPLTQLQCSKTAAGRLHDSDLSWQTTSLSSSPSSGAHRSCGIPQGY